MCLGYICEFCELLYVFDFFFFFKQKTAYEMRISDWSSDVCSSDLMIRPGWTRATQNSGAPLPLPMRTSAGLVLTGTSGKMRIHTRPSRFMWRVTARRAASIWRAVTRPGSAALRPYAPKFSAVPPFAVPWIRPLWAFRYLVRFGESIFRLPEPDQRTRSEEHTSELQS